jgi:endonuclease VIII
MPEGDTIFRAARTLQRALANEPVTAFESVLPKLERVDIDTPITGRTIEKVEANGKWLLIHFSGNLILLTHMLMSGSWHIYRPNEKWRRHRSHMRIVIRTAQIDAVAFNVPIAEFHTADSLRRRRNFNQLGPDVLAADYNDAEILRRLRAHPDLEIAEALLSQSILAGVGNVFKSELCFACNVNPFRKVATLSITELTCLVGTARKYLQANVTDNSGDQIVTHSGRRRTTGRADREENLWVYKRDGEPCRKCGNRIERRKQSPSARTTFWCSTCQPLPPKKSTLSS